MLATVETVELDVEIADSRFALPAPPAADFAFAAGKTSTTLPFELLNDHIYLPVKLNGKGPFRVLFDTGGANVVTPELAHGASISPSTTRGSG